MLDPSAHLLPLHLCAEHQALPVRAGGWHPRLSEVGGGVRWCARWSGNRLPIRLEYAAHRPAIVVEASEFLRKVPTVAGGGKLQSQPSVGAGEGQQGRARQRLAE